VSRRLSIGSLAVAAALWLAPAALARHVLLVGSYNGVQGQYSDIQSAVDAAQPGDVILVGPGDYKTTSYRFPSGDDGDSPAGILIATPNITLRGMNRNTVIVDGTSGGSACTDDPQYQNFGPATSSGTGGLNGIEIWKANDVSVENLTACNFLGGSGVGGVGNEIWWNGGAESGTIGGWGYYGAYLNATSTWFNPDTTLTGVQREATAAQYGIFSSNWDGGIWNNTYASNMNDSGYYIGACQQECNQVINHGWGEYDALGYSGSNSGGTLVVENSQFDQNQDGFDTNSQNGDDPSPQNGACPNNGISPITHTHSCWVFMHNDVHDNNNANVPEAGSAAQGPVGTGLSLSGARNDTVMDNLFENNGAWGTILVPYPDSGGPCTGGVLGVLGQGSCLFDEYGDAIKDNTYVNDGFFGNPTNGDFEALNLLGKEATDCFSGNTGANGGALTPEDVTLEQRYPRCSGKTVAADLNVSFFAQVLCDTQVSIISGVPPYCPAGATYPRPTGLSNGLQPLPDASELPTMPNPCAGIPTNPWCPASSTSRRARARARAAARSRVAARRRVAARSRAAARRRAG
jgi:hypothetical protein